jgi:8-oxo-dGTP pyrophosphatase MutT (NUDIX family)
MSTLPLRDRVSLYVTKDGYIMFGYHAGGIHFPGGGLDGDTLEVAAKKQPKEELGIAITGVVRLEDAIITPFPTSTAKSIERAKLYSGILITSVFAEYDYDDDSLYGNDDDIFHVSTDKLSVDSLIKLIEDGPYSVWSPSVISALREIKQRGLAK